MKKGRKTPLAKWTSIMAKLENQILEEKMRRNKKTAARK